MPKLYTNPETNESLTAAEWSQKLGLTLSGFRNRIRRGSFDNPFIPFFQEDPNTLIENPQTGEKATVSNWAKKLGMGHEGFRSRIEKWGVDDPRTFRSCVRVAVLKPLTKRELEEYHCPDMRHELAKLNGVKFCTNPITGESRLAADWAERYGVPLVDFYRAMKKHGRNSVDLYRFFEQSTKALG
jgi:hypothetical protein